MGQCYRCPAHHSERTQATRGRPRTRLLKDNNRGGDGISAVTIPRPVITNSFPRTASSDALRALPHGKLIRLYDTQVMIGLTQNLSSGHTEHQDSFTDEIHETRDIHAYREFTTIYGQNLTAVASHLRPHPHGTVGGCPNI